MNISQLPNLITVSRIALVPVLILLLKDQEYTAALVVFVIAGISDGLDGWLAKRYQYTSRIGAILDPAADKILVLSSYVMLTVLGHVPFWLMLCVAFRDLLIVGAYIAYTTSVGPVHMQPSYLSKFNTVMQLILIIALLAVQATAVSLPWVIDILIYAVLVTTVTSGLHYIWIWGVLKEIEPATRSKAAGD